MPVPSHPARRALAAAVVLALSAAACTGERPSFAETTTTGETTTTTEPADAPAEVAQARGSSLDVFDGPADATPTQTLVSGEDTTAEGVPLVLLVLGSEGERLRVALPGAPPGSTGWVRAADVERRAVPFRVEVALTERRLRVFERGEEVFDEPIGVGTTDRPDPGSSYLRELLEPPDPEGPYGPYVYGLAGYPIDLDDFARGSGVVAISGTQDPASIGTISPRGSLRLANDAIERLVRDVGLPLGTPVIVQA